MISNLLTKLRLRLETRRRYLQALAEISALTNHDLLDMGGDRGEMQRTLHRQIYG